MDVGGVQRAARPECLMTTHTADQCPENDPEVRIKWAIDDEIDATEHGTIVEYPTYQEQPE